MIDPYDILGIARTAGEEEIKAAFKRWAKATHPDAGGAVEEFVRGQKSAEMLLDPLRRKVFDATGFDPTLADAADLQGALVIEKLVNDVVLDERAPGSFDLVALMRARLFDDARKARGHICEMDRHIARMTGHLERLGMRPITDPLGHMLQTRVEVMQSMNRETEKQIAALERARKMLDSYVYSVDTLEETTVPERQQTKPARDP